MLNLRLSFRLHTLKFYDHYKENVFIKFNLMDLTGEGAKLDWSPNCTHGNYQLATRFIRSYFTNHESPPDAHIKRRVSCCCPCKCRCTKLGFKCETFPLENGLDEDDSLHNFGYAHFYVPIFRHPTCNIFVHVMLLGMLNLAFFFPDIRGNIGSLSLLTLGYIGLIPTIRASIPETPQVLLMEIFLYSSIFAMLITLAQILINARHQYDKEQFVWYREPLFWVVAAMNLFYILIVVFLFACHRCGWVSRYFAEFEHFEMTFCRMVPCPLLSSWRSSS